MKPFANPPQIVWHILPDSLDEVPEGRGWQKELRLLRGTAVRVRDRCRRPALRRARADADSDSGPQPDPRLHDRRRGRASSAAGQGCAGTDDGAVNEGTQPWPATRRSIWPPEPWFTTLAEGGFKRNEFVTGGIPLTNILTKKGSAMTSTTGRLCMAMVLTLMTVAAEGRLSGSCCWTWRNSMRRTRSCKSRNSPRGSSSGPCRTVLGQKLDMGLKKLGVDPNHYDELHFEIKPLGSQVGLHATLFGMPTENELTSWYTKFRTATDKWSTGRFDLRVDDNGADLRASSGGSRPASCVSSSSREVPGISRRAEVAQGDLAQSAADPMGGGRGLRAAQH